MKFWPFGIIGSILCIILGSSCRTNKAFQHSGPVPDRTNTQIFQALSNHNYSFDWFTCESGMDLDTPDERVGGKIYLRIKKDSIIWSSVKKLSVEAARILITENTYAAINRLEGTYQKGSTTEAIAKMGLSLDFRDLQETLFGNIILPDSLSSSVQKEGVHYIIKAIDQDLQLKYWINAYDLELDRIKMIDYRGREVSIEFDNYQVLESGQKVPFLRHYILPYDERGSADIIMKVKNIEIDIAKKTTFTIPTRYERVQ